MSSQIPKTYYRLFTLVDPLIALWGASLFLLAPETVTSSYLPAGGSPGTPLDPSTSHPAAAGFPSPASLRAYSLPLHAQIAGHLLATALLSALLLRAVPDLAVWRLYQLAVLVVDAFVLYGTFASYAAQGRLVHLAAWRLEDWAAVGMTTLIALTRAAFLLRLGFPKAQRAKAA
ncbi:hypothetical protein EsH8_VII_000907 [Colletotrichum jinshuiense]